MDRNAWKELIIKAVKEYDLTTVNVLAKFCEQAETAKSILRNKGYGVTGEDIVETVGYVPDEDCL